MIPSLLQIPSAVSDSKLHSVLPNNGKGDFTFDRSTGATRINKDGLIEEVGYFSSELVQNGNFSELGSELVTNGDFATNTNWGFIGTARINDGCGVFPDTTSSYIFQTNIFDLTVKTYKLVYEVKESNSGTLRLSGGNSAFGTVDLNSSIGTHTFYLVSNGTKRHLQFFNASSFVGKIDNVSVKQVDPNDRWTATNAVVTAGIGEITIDDTANAGGDSRATQSFTTVVGSTYRVKFNRVSTTSTFFLGIGGGTGYNNVFYSDLGTSTGLYQRIFVATSTTSRIALITGGTGISKFSNVSIVEVQGDRPRLSYDITNGVVEDKPHLLLEPSATNLVTFSEDLLQLTNENLSITINAATSPEGINNAVKLVPTINSAQHRIKESISVSTSTVYTASVFAKSDGYNRIRLVENHTTGGDARFDLQNGTILTTNGVTAKIEAFPNDWYRCSITETTASTTFRFDVIVMDDSSNSTFAGDGTSGVQLFGMQLEQQSYATSYIPTAGTTITRAAETCNNSKPSVNSTEGVLYAEVASLTTEGAGATRLSVNDGSQDNNVTIGYSASNTVRIIVRSSASNQALITSTQTITDFLKIAVKYKANDFALYINGSLIGTDTSGSAPSGMNDVSFDRGDGTLDWYGKVKGLAVYNEALSESQLMQLTGVTASSIYSNFVTRTASFTVEALNEVKKVIDNL